jgi:hypothetical protein
MHPGVNGIECRAHVLMKDGAHQKHGLKPKPDPESELQRTLPRSRSRATLKLFDSWPKYFLRSL